jgi:hypothetical protein
MQVIVSTSLLLHCGRSNFETSDGATIGGTVDANNADSGTVNQADAGPGSARNIVFTTSAKFRGDLNGVAGANQKCQSAANATGIGAGKEFIALLAADTYRAFDRMQTSRGWYRPDGMLVADRAVDFVAGQINSVLVDEFGTVLPDVFNAWTGMLPNGDSAQNCALFTSAASSAVGNEGDLIDRNGLFFGSNDVGCDSVRRLVCVSVGVDNPPVIQSPTGKRLFTSSNPFSPNADGLAQADDVCRTEAIQAGITTNTDFIALLPTNNASAISRLTDVAAAYFRMDGTMIGKLSEAPTTFLGMNARSTFVEGGVWTGGPPKLAPTNSCTSWSDNSQGVANIGYSSGALSSTFVDKTWSCDGLFLLYCVER